MNDPTAEGAPGPFGMERVVARGLEGYRELPDSQLGLINQTLNAIATDSRPREILTDFLGKPPSAKNAAAMLDTLNRIEEQFAPSERKALLTPELVNEVWENEQGIVGGLIYALLDEQQTDLPVEERYFSTYLTYAQQEELSKKLEDAEVPFPTIVYMTKAISDALKEPATAKMVFAYRAALRNDSEAAERLYGEILGAMTPFVEDRMYDSDDLNDEAAMITAHYLLNYVAAD